MLSIIQQLLVAGNETTTKMLTEMMRLLGEHHTEWDALRADASRAKAVVEETLRMSTPTQGMFRVVTKDTQVAGVDLSDANNFDYHPSFLLRGLKRLDIELQPA